MRGFRLTTACLLAVVATTLAGCNSDEPELPVESLAQLVDRLTTPGPSGAAAVTTEPTSYRIEFARYTEGLAARTKVLGTGSNRRRALKATSFVRDVVRPFTETGGVTRTIGFVREAAAATSRVAFVRPLPDDPRPLLYPPPPDKHSRKLVIAGRDCYATTVGTETYCIEGGTGLVLMTQAKQSLEIATQVTVGDELKTPDELAAPLLEGFSNKERGSIRPIHPDSAPPGTDWSLIAPPAGFTLVGRYAVAPLTAEAIKRTRKVTANIVDVYVRGADGLVVERGGKLDLTAVGDEDIGALDAAHDVELGALGAGKAGIGGIGPFGYREVRAFPSTGRYIVVAGTLPEAELVAVARSLKSWPGTKIIYLDES